MIFSGWLFLIMSWLMIIFIMIFCIARVLGDKENNK